MAERPILFSTPMVRAILDGRKTQTRRIVKDIPLGYDFVGASEDKTYLRAITDKGRVLWTIDPRWHIGDVLWVRETWKELQGAPDIEDGTTDTGNYVYKADDEAGHVLKWKPSIFMPKEACRIKLRVTDIRVEQLQDISYEDAIAEGIESDCQFYRSNAYLHQYKDYERGDFDCDSIGSYMTLWESINGKGSWDKNPFVWVITFERITNP